jgi:hypothetical protein
VDNESLELIEKVWRHNGVAGHVWMPHIYAIGQKGKERFREGPVVDARKPVFPDLRDSVDWYWTPGVSSSDSRKAKEYPAQRVIWVDCDESYNDKLLQDLKPSYMWETSPGHKQAVWLLSEPVVPADFHRDGFMGMLTQALGGDKSGVDVGQLLRVPGTWHHKREPFEGRILRKAGNVYTRGQVLSRVAKGLGFSPGLASELGADDPYGDRSKVLWKFSRNAAELGLAQDLVFKLIKATKWNKWKDDPDRLKEDIARAYAQQPATAPERDAEQQQAKDQHDVHDDVVEDAEPWGMATVDSFGPVIRKPVSWVLPGIIPEAGCGLLVSAPKVGKTRIAIEMALGLATGRKPLGIALGRPLAVGFFSLEDGEYLFSSRLDGSLNRDHGRYRFHWDGHIKPVEGKLVWEPPQPMSLFTNFAQIDLSDDSDKQRLYETILKYELKLVVIDTLSMAIGKSDVSNSKDMYAILKDIKTIAKTTGCAIMFIHHTRKRVFEKGESIQEMVLGSTALHAWSDFIMNLVAPSEESDMLRLGVQTKMGNNLHYIDSHLKIIKRPPVEEVVA